MELQIWMKGAMMSFHFRFSILAFVLLLGTLSGTVNAQDTCDGGSWSLIPLDVFRQSRGDGFDTVVITLAAYNGGRYVGSLIGTFSGSTSTITTEEGFTYSGLIGYAAAPPDYIEKHFPSVSRDAYYALGTEIFLPYVAPNLIVRGVGTSNQGIARLVFLSASTQQTFDVSIANAMISCLQPDGTVVRERADFRFRVPDHIQSVDYPLLGDVELPTLDSVITLPIGTLELTDIRRSNTKPEQPTNGQPSVDQVTEYIVLDFEFTNWSRGYSANGYLYGWLVGESGIIADGGVITDGYDRITAGPGQTRSVRLYVPSRIGEQDLALTLIYKDERFTIEIPLGTFQISRPS